MRCYTAELDRLRAPTMSKAISLTRWSRVPHLMRRAMWVGSSRALGLFGVRPQAVQAMRGSVRQEAPAFASDDELAKEILVLPAYAPPPRDRPRVVHVIGSLSAGGAERQLVYLARESLRGGSVEARIMLTNPLVGTAAHYLPLAQDGGVIVEVAGATRDEATAAALALDKGMQRRLIAVDPAYRPWVIELACEFVRLKPDVVHAWLDHANIWSAIAAFVAGVPTIVLSTRNVNPSNFPMIDAPYFLAWYRRLAGSERVRFIGNSRVGAEDYADWMGVARERFAVIPNGFDHAAMQPPDAARLAALRAELGVEDRRVVLGVFRVAEEKEPLDFARAANSVLCANSDACVLVAGDGPMKAALEAQTSAVDAARFRLLGRRSDVAALLSIADVVMHASRKEGTPNALLEAQALGCPVVATRGGGTVDAVEHGGSGFLCDVGDTDALSRHVLEVLGDDALRARLSTRARAFVTERFGLQRMVDDSLAVYAREERG